MKTDDFEKRLQRVSAREVPSAWREEILTAAQEVQSAHHPSNAVRPGFLSTLIHQLSTLTRPQRAAWSGLATVWLVILALNMAARDNSSTAQNRNLAAPSPQALAAWRQQRRELAGLTDLMPARPIVTPPKQSLPQPRSSRRDECLTT